MADVLSDFRASATDSTVTVEFHVNGARKGRAWVFEDRNRMPVHDVCAFIGADIASSQGLVVADRLKPLLAAALGV